MRITVRTESGSTHTVLLPTGSGTSKQEAMMLLTAANVREGREGGNFAGWLEVEARSESDSLWIRHDTIIEVLLEPMDTSPTLIDVRTAEPDIRKVMGDALNAKADSRDMWADIREVDADAREAAVELRESAADERDAAGAREGLSDIPTPDARR